MRYWDQLRVRRVLDVEPQGLTFLELRDHTKLNIERLAVAIGAMANKQIDTRTRDGRTVYTLRRRYRYDRQMDIGGVPRGTGIRRVGAWDNQGSPGEQKRQTEKNPPSYRQDGESRARQNGRQGRRGQDMAHGRRGGDAEAPRGTDQGNGPPEGARWTR